MGKRAHLWLFVIVFCIGLLMAGKTIAQDDVADVPCKEFFAGCDTNKRYFLIGDGEKIDADDVQARDIKQKGIDNKINIG